MSIVYVGNFSYHRGLLEFLYTLSSAFHINPGLREFVRVNLIGYRPGSSYSQLLFNALEELSLFDNVKLTPWKSDGGLNYIRDCTALVIPHLNNPHTSSTVPHKLYTALSFGKPVLLSDILPFIRISSDYPEVCFVYRSASQLADLLAELRTSNYSNFDFSSIPTWESYNTPIIESTLHRIIS